jgi:hypothetical protein
LEDEKVRKSIINTHKYKVTYDNFEETIELKISEEEHGYDRITYEIEITPHNSAYYN